MDAIIESVRSGGDIGKGLFLMACGMGFVFAVQVLFFLVIVAWPKPRKG